MEVPQPEPDHGSEAEEVVEPERAFSTGSQSEDLAWNREREQSLAAAPESVDLDDWPEFSLAEPEASEPAAAAVATTPFGQADELMAKIWEVMDASGLTQPGRLAVQQELGEDSLFDLLALEVGVPELSQWIKDQVRDMVKHSSTADQLWKRRRSATLPSDSLLLQDVLWSRQEKPGRIVEDHLTNMTVPVPAVMAYHPKRGIRKLKNQITYATGEGDRQERASKERRLLESLLSEILSWLEESEAPVWFELQSCSDPQKASWALLRGARGSTVRTKVRMWRSFRQWLQTTFQINTPFHLEHVLSFLHMRGDEPCGHSVPSSFLASLSWMEKLAGYPAHLCFSGNPLVEGTVKDLKTRLSAHAGPLRQSLRFFSGMMVSLEFMVMDESVALGLRAMAWTRLVKAWASLRHDDLAWLSPSAIIISESGLSATMARTKTTGGSKRVRTLPVYVSREAFFFHEKWLDEGWALWQRFAPWDRDHFFVHLSADFQSASPGMASYSEVASVDVRVLQELKMPMIGAGNVVLAYGEPLIPAWMARLWTEHSERNLLSSALACLGFSKEQRAVLGRWSPSGADDYVRTFRAMVARCQLAFAEAVKKGESFLTFDEDAIAVDMELKLRLIPKASLHDVKEELKELVKSMKRASWACTVAQGSVPWLSVPLALEPMVVEAAVPEQKPPFKFLLCYTKNRRSSRLHRTGTQACWWSRCEELQDSSDREEEPHPLEYNSRCRLCWPDLGESDSSGEDSESS